jgi:hypothetical protein
MDVRVRLVAPRYRPVADELLARPSATDRRRAGLIGEPFSLADRTGRLVAVAWIWRPEMAVIVHRPGPVPERGPLSDTADFAGVCRRVAAAWYYCTTH